MRRPLLRRRRRRLKGLSFNRMIPNILTLLALCAGMTAIRFGYQGQWELAVVAILLAAVLDALDGRIARLLGGTSRFGAELDSLSDFVSFGIAPAMVLFFWAMREVGGIGWAISLLFAVCCGLRLARFNVSLESDQVPAWGFNFFTGVPAPAGAALALMPMILTFAFGLDLFGEPAVVGAGLLAVAFLMVSRIPTYSFKNFKIPNRYVLPTLIVVALFAAFLVSAPWMTLSVVGFLYLAGIPLSLRSYRRLKEQAAELQAESEGPAAAAPSPESGATPKTEAGEERPAAGPIEIRFRR
ncbi:MAG: CDP-diacylglycerol--serine O-phosphatidyltransferase [Proteobacteria bacterium]|nr:CDP-diacylglycerol--serine O-phosphatidyltransferase [Pseudomonadota bacterium]